MAAIMFFAVPDEIRDIISCFCQKHELSALAFSKGKTRGQLVDLESLSTSKLNRLLQLVLFPFRVAGKVTKDINKIRPAEQGWITVFPGKITKHRNKTFLVMTQIVGEKNARLKTISWLGSLRKNLRHSMYSGVRVVDPVTAKSFVYTSVMYTYGALDVLDAGWKWTQFVPSKADFIPAGNNSTGEAR